PSSQIAVSNMSWRVLSRARINHGVVVDMFLCSPVPRHLYTDEYSSVAIPGLLDIHTKPMIRRLRLIQFLEESGRPRTGWVTPDGKAAGGVGSFESTYELARAALASGDPLDAFAGSRTTPPSHSYAQLIQERRLLPPLTHPDPARCLVS